MSIKIYLKISTLQNAGRVFLQSTKISILDYILWTIDYGLWTIDTMDNVLWTVDI